MKVEFKYGWFGPDAKLYEKGVQEVPDHLFDFLPSSAKLADGKVEVKTEKKASLKDFDDLRANSDATVELLTKFDKEQKKGK